MTSYVATRTILASGKRYRAGDALPADGLGEAGIARLLEIGAARAAEPSGGKKPGGRKPGGAAAGSPAEASGAPGDETSSSTASAPSAGDAA